VVDTAGLRDTHDEVERIGVARSWTEIESADAVIFLHDLTRMGQADYDGAETQIEHRLSGLISRTDQMLHVYNKLDLAAAEPPSAGVALSAQTGQGLQTLRSQLLQLVGWTAPTEGVFTARTRHVQALKVAAQHLRQAQSQLNRPTAELDLLAEELRLAHDSLGEITGVFTSDQLLGEIFSRFCIGK
jgi:tRNA modification GTPase